MRWRWEDEKNDADTEYVCWDSLIVDELIIAVATDARSTVLTSKAQRPWRSEALKRSKTTTAELLMAGSSAANKDKRMKEYKKEKQ